MAESKTPKRRSYLLTFLDTILVIGAVALLVSVFGTSFVSFSKLPRVSERPYTSGLDSTFFIEPHVYQSNRQNALEEIEKLRLEVNESNNLINNLLNNPRDVVALEQYRQDKSVVDRRIDQLERLLMSPDIERMNLPNVQRRVGELETEIAQLGGAISRMHTLLNTTLVLFATMFAGILVLAVRNSWHRPRRTEETRPIEAA